MWLYLMIFVVGDNMKKKHIIMAVMIGCIILVITNVLLLSKNGILENNKEFCIVQFESSGGNNIRPQKVKCGTTALEPAAPQKEGFIFIGWFQDGILFDFSDHITDNTILQALWKTDKENEIVFVTFDSQGGTKINDIEVLKGKKIYAPINPVKENFVFVTLCVDAQCRSGSAI
mgnify:CR=1 FL=1